MRLTSTKLVALAALTAVATFAQGRRPTDARIDVEKYTIEARVDPNLQMLTAKVKLQFTPDADASEMTLGFHQSMELHTVTTESGDTVPVQRVADSNIRLQFSQPFPKGK